MSDPASNGGGRSMAAVQREIVEEMEGLDGPLEKYGYLVGLGRALEEPVPSIRDSVHAVPGCQSRVWIRADLEGDHLRIRADGEAMITRGIIALLLRVLDDRTPEEIAEGDLFFLDRTGLGAHLSPSRANGLSAMVRQIRTLAEQARNGAR